MLLPGENVLSTQQGEKDNGRGRVDAMNFKNPYLWMFKKTTKKQEKSLGLGIAYRSLGSAAPHSNAFPQNKDDVGYEKKWK